MDLRNQGIVCRRDNGKGEKGMPVVILVSSQIPAKAKGSPVFNWKRYGVFCFFFVFFHS